MIWVLQRILRLLWLWNIVTQQDMSLLILSKTPSLLVIHNFYLDMTSHLDYVHLFGSLYHVLHLQIHIRSRNNSLSPIVVVWLWVVFNGQKKISRPYNLQSRNNNFLPSLSSFMKCSHQISFHCQPERQWVWVLCWDSCHAMISLWIDVECPCKSYSIVQVSQQNIYIGMLHACSCQSEFQEDSLRIVTLWQVPAQAHGLKVA